MRYLPALVVAALFGATAQAQDYTRYQGAWKGPFLFSVVQPDIGVQGAPAVHPGAIQIDPDGTVRGSVPEAACTMAGSSTDFVSPANASLDLTLSGCSDTRFNGHFSGRLINNPILKYGSLRLSSMHSLDAGTAQLSAIIHH
ncbi:MULTISPECIES: hypothetical protein [unclassified Variovorax]|uniref:hypothetical protein n=1 Tax=unclassified Variovorax TaxID=663243 RepID=UPI001317E42F|nr:MULTISPECIES: hypothetical protein [unclassified Variovorax]VTU23126.1 hypothetical protein SRS16CHR_03189 [Variovorax sp. SRS16]VTU31339.1 hypothetical protein E5CHR_03196 [Variovorax sp. PBL-E5]